MLKIPMKSPTVRTEFLLTNTANTSVPSITLHPLTAIPIPAQRKNHPKIATRSLSFVSAVISKNLSERASVVTAKNALIAKRRDI
jgi:hypothetical protein